MLGNSIKNSFDILVTYDKINSCEKSIFVAYTY